MAVLGILCYLGLALQWGRSHRKIGLRWRGWWRWSRAGSRRRGCTRQERPLVSAFLFWQHKKLFLHSDLDLRNRWKSMASDANQSVNAILLHCERSATITLTKIYKLKNVRPLERFNLVHLVGANSISTSAEHWVFYSFISKNFCLAVLVA